MGKLTRILFLLSGIALLCDSILLLLEKSHPIPGWPLPCPITFLLLSLGLISFAVESK